MIQTLERQKEMSRKLDSEYVFITTQGIPIRQENLGKRWKKAFAACGIKYRTLYQTRHTFASRSR